MTSGMRYKYPDIVVILDSLDFPAPQSGLGTSLAQLVPIPGSPYPAAVIEDELIGVIYATRVSSLVGKVHLSYPVLTLLTFCDRISA